MTKKRMHAVLVELALLAALLPHAATSERPTWRGDWRGWAWRRGWWKCRGRQSSCQRGKHSQGCSSVQAVQSWHHLEPTELHHSILQGKAVLVPSHAQSMPVWLGKA